MSFNAFYLEFYLPSSYVFNAPLRPFILGKLKLFQFFIDLCGGT